MNSQYRYDWTVLLQIFVLVELNGYRGKEAVKGNVSITVTNRGEIQSSTVYVKNYFPFATTFALCLDCKTVRIFAYSSTREQSNKRSGTRPKTESETGERRGCEARALRARNTLTPPFTDFFTDFEKKTTVLQSTLCLAVKVIQLFWSVSCCVQLRVNSYTNIYNSITNNAYYSK